jgi:hypothetical protein
MSLAGFMFDDIKNKTNELISKPFFKYYQK